MFARWFGAFGDCYLGLVVLLVIVLVCLYCCVSLGLGLLLVCVVGSCCIGYCFACFTAWCLLINSVVVGDSLLIWVVGVGYYWFSGLLLCWVCG